jgi:hypothetical protein
MARGRKSTTISNASAMRNMRGRSDASRAIDAVRPSKKIDGRPTKRWSERMDKSDAKGIDDGSPKAKARNAGAIKRHFGKIGRRGAYTTNRKRANSTLRSQTDQMKDLRQRSRNATGTEAVSISKRIDTLKRSMVRQQQIIANKPN